MLNITTLFQAFGLDINRRTRLVRHQDKRYDVLRLFRSGNLNVYQSIQPGRVFGDAQTLVSFVGQPGTHALFAGVYTVKGSAVLGTHTLPAGFLYPEMQTKNCYRYDLELDSRFDELAGRLVIDWGLGTRSWVQFFKPKPIVEIRPPGFVKAFPGFLDVLLSFSELQDIVRNPVTNREWHQMLKSVAGIYLLVDTSSGKQYVGSAYGQGGILGRWRSYAATGHADNVQLRQLLASHPGQIEHFQFSILQTLPTTLTPQEVIAYESLHKQKLGSRAYGLNSN